jgi:hypothetical protein
LLLTNEPDLIRSSALFVTPQEMSDLFQELKNIFPDAHPSIAALVRQQKLFEGTAQLLSNYQQSVSRPDGKYGCIFVGCEEIFSNIPELAQHTVAERLKRGVAICSNCGRCCKNDKQVTDAHVAFHKGL